MEDRLIVATIWGIPIRLHFSWFLVFGLVTWSLAGGYFPVEYPSWAQSTYWLVGAVTSLLFFGSILVHELGHSWVALRNAIPIKNITLFIFGGVAQVGREPTSPGIEFRIAIAGPLTSVGLAGLFGAAWLVAREVALLEAPAIWLARINLMVALFNLIPAFPLDGGRVLRAIVWRWTASPHRATLAASFSGQLLAFGLIAFGIVVGLRGNVLAGVWMVLIGWFLQNAAAASHAQANLRELLRGVTVAQAMTREFRSVGRDSTLERLVREEVLGAGRRCFFVMDDGHLRGLLTLHEVRAVARERWGEVAVGDVMVPAERLASIGPEAELLVALEKMDDAGVAQMPVVEGGRLLGLIGREQILHYVRIRAELGM